ncbi:MAG TPA: lanthionine synthetase LanC family protein [Gemmatimonadaceae bacterium]|nr:lanthionine synthetase LanC family protein [Gemmatimonadaceae bacterium]
MSGLAESMVLPADVAMVPVTSLRAEDRARLSCQNDDFAIARPATRAGTRIIGPDAAALLGYFRAPITIPEAVLAYSRARSLDPHQVLRDSYTFLRELFESRLLVASGSGDRFGVRASLKNGECVERWEIRRALHVVDDTEVYLARDARGRPAAIKVAGGQAAARTPPSLVREAAVLSHLGGVIAPRLLAEGMLQDRPYLVLEWCPGVDADRAAADIRGCADDSALPRLRELCLRILDAYALLHDRGVIHGDVHPGNVLVDCRGTVRLVDFALARWSDTGTGAGEPSDRGGVTLYYEPEVAVAALAGQRPPLPTLLGEQYAVGALLYRLVTDTYYLDFTLAEYELLRQIRDEPMVPIGQRGAWEWAGLEKALEQSLAKDPSQRFPSMSSFAAALRDGASPAAIREAVTLGRAPRLVAVARKFVSDSLAELRIDAPLFRDALATPRERSIIAGSAGIALALLRVARLRNDAALLSLADVWSELAMRSHGDDSTQPLSPSDRDVFDRRFPYWSVGGAHCVAALVALAMGDERRWVTELSSFLDEGQVEHGSVELASGHSGSLLACALLMEPAAEFSHGDAGRLAQRGTNTLNRIWSILDHSPAAEPESTPRTTGILHGLAGPLCATMHWCRVSGDRIPDELLCWLEHLASMADECGRGLSWPHGMPGAESSDVATSQWCGGSAGLVHLWWEANTALGEERYAQLAERATWHAWEDASRHPDLCCGLAGRAYALLRTFRETGDGAWRERAERLATWAREGAGSLVAMPHSLYKGRLGVALLLAELEEPMLARMPFFESGAWS